MIQLHERCTVALTAPPGLLVRPIQRATESDGGFLLRLAHVNGIRPLWSKARHGECVTSPSLGIARWCPQCLSAPGTYWRRSWTEGAPVCRNHCCWLQDRCEACGALAAWRNLRLLQCRCGADLALQPAAPWSDAVQKVLLEPEEIAEPCIGLADEGQRFALAEVVGALDRYGLHGKPLKRSSARAVASQHGIVERGAWIVVNAAEELQSLLERLRVPSPAGQRVQLVSEAWPGLLRLLKRRLTGPVLRWMTNQIAKLPERALSDGVAIQRGGSSGNGPSGIHGLAKAVGVRVERVPALLSDCGVAVPTRRSKVGRRMSAVTDSVVTRVRDHLRDLLTARAAQRRFGLAAKRLEELALAGLVRRMGNQYSASSIQGLLEGCAGPAGTEASESAHHEPRWCSLHQALRLHIGNPQTAALFTALLGGSLSVRRVKLVEHARDLLLVEPEVKAWSRASEVVGEELTIPKAAALLGLKQEVVYHLVGAGLLATSRQVAGRRAARVISRSEIHRFQSQVSPLAEMARAHGVDHRCAKRWATERQLTLVSGPTVDGGRQYFVRIERS